MQTKPFILYYRSDDTNLAELDKLLADGWRVNQVHELEGISGPPYQAAETRRFLILVK